MTLYIEKPKEPTKKNTGTEKWVQQGSKVQVFVKSIELL